MSNTPTKPAEPSSAELRLIQLKDGLATFHNIKGAARAAQLGQLFWHIKGGLRALSDHTTEDWRVLLSTTLPLLPLANHHAHLNKDPASFLTADVKGLIAVLRKNPDRAKRFIDEALRIHRDLRVSSAFFEPTSAGVAQQARATDP